jgi:putative flavoprotein involved in K+ transport
MRRTVNRTWVDAVVVGAGPAGLAASHALARAGQSHVVLERGRVGWSWRTQRWDSFRLNTPVWASRVPGRLMGEAPGAFATAGSFVAGLERLASDLPVLEGVEVRRAERLFDLWRIETSDRPLATRTVVVASGFQNVPRRPGFARSLPASIEQLHAGEYRSPDALRGPVLVVGGGQSGLQIADDVLAHGHRVYLATSRVGRLPRRHRGRDAFEWMRAAGQLDLLSESVDPDVMAAAPPQISGAGTVSYQALADRGATLLGRALAYDGRRLELAGNLGENVRFADESSGFFRATWDAVAERIGHDAGHEPDPADVAAPHLYRRRGPRSLDLAASGIRTVIWATGFGPSIDWLPAGALDDRNRPQLPGLHAVGAPWLTHRSSGSLYGMVSDAGRIADSLAGGGLRLVA